MTDNNTAGTEGGTQGDGQDAFDAEWNALRDEKAGQGASSPDADKALERTSEESVDGQADEAPQRQAAETPAKASETDDLWAGADSRLREAFEAQRSRADKAENAIRSQNGRLSQAQHRLNDLEGELEQFRKGKASQGTEGQDADEQTREERLAKLREDYPEVAAPILAELDNLRQKVGKLDTAHQSQAQERSQAFVDEQISFVSEAHPDWRDVVMSPEYAKWAETAPRYIREAISRNAQQIVDGEEVADVLARFRADTKQPDPEAERLQAKRERQFSASRSTETRTPAARPGGADTNDFDAEWDRRARARRASGRK